MRRFSIYCLAILLLAAPLLMHAGVWLVGSGGPQMAVASSDSAPSNRLPECPQHQSKKTDCCPQCIVWLQSTQPELLPVAVHSDRWLPAPDLSPATSPIVSALDRDDGGGLRPRQVTFKDVFARTARLRA